MQQDTIYLQRLKREAASSKPQAPSATKRTQLNNIIFYKKEINYESNEK